MGKGKLGLDLILWCYYIHILTEYCGRIVGMCLSSEVLLFVAIDIVVEDCYCRYLLFSSVALLVFC